jgi:serine/threonine-protein kinase HipA
MPAYDFVSTLPYIAGDRLALSFGGSKDIEGITADQIRRFAEMAGLPLQPIIKITKETLEATISAWRTLESKSVLPKDIHAIVHTHIESTAQRAAKAFAGS